MKENNRKEFLQWYIQKVQENYVFYLQKDLVQHFNSDVDILRHSCIAFLENFLEIANIDPFQYITLGVIDTNLKDQYSKPSISWFMSFENPNIKHFLNGGEMKIYGDKVDGFDEETNTVYKFRGCFWHGCPHC